MPDIYFSFLSDYQFLLDPSKVSLLMRGLGMTIILALIGVFVGGLLGLVPAFMRLSPFRALRFIATAYVEVIRGTPLFVQLLLIYSMMRLPTIIFLGIDMGSFIPGVTALVINSSAYVSEIVRAGINAVDRGQSEAARSLGMTPAKTMQKIILPQAIKNILPALGNEFVTIIKETSIFMYVGIAELLFAANIIKTQTYQVQAAYVVAAVLYFCLTFPTSKLIAYFERRMRRADGKTPHRSPRTT